MFYDSDVKVLRLETGQTLLTCPDTEPVSHNRLTDAITQNIRQRDADQLVYKVFCEYATCMA